MMTIPQPATTQAGSNTSGAARLLVLVTSVYFTGGVATVLLDTLVPKFKALFALSYTEVMLTQFCFFLAYLVASLPAGLFVARFGYLRGIVLGLGLMTTGCLLFAPAAAGGVYYGFLAALFVLASGITVFQVGANPLVASLGRTETPHSRLTLALAFNSLGTVVGPLIGAALILQHGVGPAGGRAEQLHEAHIVARPFLGIACILAMIASALWLSRSRVRQDQAAASSEGYSAALLRRPRLMLGVGAMFLYVGAEVAIGSLLTNFLMLGDTMNLAASQAGRTVAFYWGGALVGRLLGSVILARFSAGRVLCGAAIAAMLLTCTATSQHGPAAGLLLIAVGLFNAIMFPTIFTLSIENLKGDTGRGSSLLAMAIVGGAIVPLATGAIADAWGLRPAFLLPAFCYLLVAGFGLFARRPASDPVFAAPSQAIRAD